MLRQSVGQGKVCCHGKIKNPALTAWVIEIFTFNKVGDTVEIKAGHKKEASVGDRWLQVCLPVFCNHDCCEQIKPGQGKAPVYPPKKSAVIY